MLVETFASAKHRNQKSRRQYLQVATIDANIDEMVSYCCTQSQAEYTDRLPRFVRTAFSIGDTVFTSQSLAQDLTVQFQRLFAVSIELRLRLRCRGPSLTDTVPGFRHLGVGLQA